FHVTGVQTCALPISCAHPAVPARGGGPRPVLARPARGLQRLAPLRRGGPSGSWGQSPARLAIPRGLRGAGGDAARVTRHGGIRRTGSPGRALDGGRRGPPAPGPEPPSVRRRGPQRNRRRAGHRVGPAPPALHGVDGLASLVSPPLHP